MKISALRRLVAICLAVISLSMLVSGGLGLHTAKKEHRKADAEIRSLRENIEDYREISVLLTDRESYETLNGTLKDQQKKYENDTARHRAELANYSAANGGLEMGAKALGEAEAALAAGRTQYEAGKRTLKTMENAMNQAYAMYADYMDLITKVPMILGSMGSILDNLSEYQEKLKETEELVDTLNSDLADLAEMAERLAKAGSQQPGQNTELGENQSEESVETDGNEEEDGTTPADELNPEPDENENPDNEAGDDPGIEGNSTPLTVGSDPKPETNEIQVYISGTDDNPGKEVNREDEETEQKEIVSAKEETEKEDTTRAETNEEEIPTSPKTGEEENTDGIAEDKTEDKQQETQEQKEDLSGAYLAQLETVRQDADAVSRAVGDSETEDSLCWLLNEVQKESGVLSNALQGLNIPDSAIKMVLSSAGIDTGFLTPELLETLDSIKEQSENVSEAAGQATAYADFVSGFADMMLKPIREDADEITIWNSDELNAGEIGNMQDQFADHRETLQSLSEIMDDLDLAEAEGVFDDLNAEIGGMTGQMGQIQSGTSQIDELRKTLSDAEDQIVAGEEALATGAAQLDEAREAQKKKAEELDREKQELDQLEKTLIQTGKETEEQKTLEDREKTIRTALLAREEIHHRTLLGEDLITASEAWLKEYTRQTENKYRDRFNASLLMIACVIPAFTGALTSFGTKKNLGITLLATLLCQAFAFSALFLLQRMGRGISWSATITGLIATAELVLLIPALIPPRHAASAVKSKPVWRSPPGPKK